MTPEEKVIQLEKDLAEERAANKKTQKNVSDQNSYITKLEQQLKDSERSQPAPQMDSIVQKYLEDMMRKDVIEKAATQLKEDYSEDRYRAVEKDFLEFLDGHMTKSKMTKEFVYDAFCLVLGKALRDKDHPIQKIGKAAPPSGTPDNPIGTNSNAIQQVQDVIKNRTAPPIISDSDLSAAGGPPSTETPVKNTKDAFANLKNRFNDAGGQRFQ